jgi:2-phosphoglycerate kinase
MRIVGANRRFAPCEAKTMHRPLLVIITGPPAAGKTTLGRQLAGALSLPFIHKDGIKEILFDVLGWRDRAWSR